MINCVLCGKECDSFDAYSSHLFVNHTRKDIIRKIADILSVTHDVIIDYKGAIFVSDLYLRDLDMIIEVFPEHMDTRTRALQFSKPYLEIFSLTSPEEINKQVDRVAYGLDSTKVYTDSECEKDIQGVTNGEGKVTLRSKTNRLIYRFQPYFFETENKLWKNDPIKRRFLIENRKKYLFKDEYMITDRELLSGMKISGLCKGYSHFNPYLLKWVINEFFYGKETKLYLPCCGWGHKLLVANCVKSIYAVDNNTKIINGLYDIRNFGKFMNTVIEPFDASVITYHESNATFICPPYYNTEIYKNKYKSYTEYIEFVRELLDKSFEKSSSERLGVVIDGKNIKVILDLYPDAKVIDLTNCKNHFTTSKTNNEYFVYVEKLQKS